jgi:hypothetical protein
MQQDRKPTTKKGSQQKTKQFYFLQSGRRVRRQGHEGIGTTKKPWFFFVVLNFWVHENEFFYSASKCSVARSSRLVSFFHSVSRMICAFDVVFLSCFGLWKAFLSFNVPSLCLSVLSIARLRQETVFHNSF